MRERSDRSFGRERSEPSWQDRAPRSEAQRSAVRQLVSKYVRSVYMSTYLTKMHEDWFQHNHVHCGRNALSIMHEMVGVLTQHWWKLIQRNQIIPKDEWNHPFMPAHSVLLM